VTPGAAFNFAEPVVLTQNRARANVLLATAAAFGLLVCWIVLAGPPGSWRTVASDRVRRRRPDHLLNNDAVGLVIILDITWAG